LQAKPAEQQIGSNLASRCVLKDNYRLREGACKRYALADTCHVLWVLLQPQSCTALAVGQSSTAVACPGGASGLLQAILLAELLVCCKDYALLS
jgi:hypothetical protein